MSIQTNVQDGMDGILSESPPTKRLRVLSKACEACKSKKSRCEGSRPQCDLCRRKGIECIYRVKGQPGLRPGYGKWIEQRMVMLEETMTKLSQTVEEIASCARTTGFVAAPSTGSVHSPTNPEVAMPGDANNPEVWMASQQPETVLLTSTPPGIASIPWSGMLPPAIDSGLPSEQILQEAAELFFEFVYPSFKMFHKANFVSNLTDPRRRILLDGILVVALRFWKKPDPPVEIRDRYTKEARERIFLHCVDACSVMSTQALALVALDAFGQGPGPRTWTIMAMLIAAAQQLGLAGSSSNPANADPSCSMVRNGDPDETLDLPSQEAEEKRRLFWIIYSLDRFSCFSHGSEYGIDSKNIKLGFPINDKDWDQIPAGADWLHQGGMPLRSDYPTNLWRCQLEVLALSDQCHQLLLQPVNRFVPSQCQEWQSNFHQLDSALCSWFENLPRDVQEPSLKFNPMWTIVHATFHAVVMRMHTVAAFPSITSPYFKPNPSACGRCRQAVRSVASLANRLQPHELNYLGPIFAFIVWCAARSLVILWTAGYENTYGSTPADLDSLLGTLRQMSTRWQCAKRYGDTIQFILDSKNEPDGLAGLKIFSDTRRTVYGLQNRLGNLVAAHNAAIELGSLFEFLEMPVLVEGSFPPTIGNDLCTFAPEVESGWTG